MMVCGVPVVNYSFDHVVSIIDSLGTAKVRGPEQGCKFSDLSLISDFLRIKETGIKLTKYVQNVGKISILPKAC